MRFRVLGQEVLSLLEFEVTNSVLKIHDMFFLLTTRQEHVGS